MKNAMMAIMGDRSDFIFIALLVAVLVLSENSLLVALLACVDRTRNFDQALRRELYPHLSV
jgi:hypothetical protein